MSSLTVSPGPTVTSEPCRRSAAEAWNGSQANSAATMIDPPSAVNPRRCTTRERAIPCPPVAGGRPGCILAPSRPSGLKASSGGAAKAPDGDAEHHDAEGQHQTDLSHEGKRLAAHGQAEPVRDRGGNARGAEDHAPQRVDAVGRGIDAGQAGHPPGKIA